MAHQLGTALYNANHDIVEIYNRSYNKGTSLARKIRAKAVEKIGELDPDIDLIIIAVSDDAINNISRQLGEKKWQSVIIVHTSGSVPSTALNGLSSYGVFYSFQSMTAGQEMDFKQVPILVHSNSEQNTDLLIQLAESISDKVYKVSDEQRGIIHVAGVFANNFSNHMVTVAHDILAKNELPLEVIKPLIVNTLQKILEMDPIDAQTGPAVRGDTDVMDKHIKFLEDQPELKNLYRLISDSIIVYHESNNPATT